VIGHSNNSRAFLTARWSNLGLITYAVEAAVLKPELPRGCELDMRDGLAFVSLVVFDFLDTRVKGCRVPRHVNFPEINLRYYVRCKGLRGVSFIREFVPRRMIAWVARRIYNEPYIATPMQSRIGCDGDHWETAHRFWFAGTWHEVRVRGLRPPVVPSAGSIDHFFKEHNWGFGKSRDGALRQYRVEHPAWAVYPDAAAEVRVDFAAVYGEKWAFLSAAVPHAVTFAVGSEVTVYPWTDQKA